MQALTKTIIAGAAAVALSATAASAAVVCNDDGDCWRVRDHLEYEPDLGLRIYEDDWHWGEGEHYRWREAGPGHGYWREGVWVEID